MPKLGGVFEEEFGTVLPVHKVQSHHGLPRGLSRNVTRDSGPFRRHPVTQALTYISCCILKVFFQFYTKSASQMNFSSYSALFYRKRPLNSLL